MVKQYTFSSKEELLEQAEKDKACSKGLEWAKNQESLEGILEMIPFGYRLWCLCKGYVQFAEHCPWDNLSGWNWSYLLSHQPKFSERCPWDNLSGWNWSHLLSFQPKFSERCPWEKLDGWDWSHLLSFQPQFESFKKVI